VDIHRRFDKVTVILMKNDNVTTALTLVLAVLAILGVIFALQTIFRTRELRSLQMQATQANAYSMGVEALANDTFAYSQKNPNADILRILQLIQAKPATR
jgi:hypothetical protein